jgi:hypothetical protein
LKSSEELLREARVQFPVLKALATSDDEARSEAISRIAGGATLGARDVSAIRANLRKVVRAGVCHSRLPKLVEVGASQSGG